MSGPAHRASERADYSAAMRRQSRAANKHFAALLQEAEPNAITESDLAKRDIQINEMAAKLAERDKKISELDMRIAELEAQDAIRDPQGGRKLAQAVARHHGLTFKQMVSVRRQKELCRARQQAMWELREYTDLSLPQIGKLLGGRDHTTVLHGCRAHAARMARGEV